MTFIVQSYFDTLLRYVLSVTFCGAVVLKVNTGSPSSKYEHRRASALLHNIQNIRICMGNKPTVSVTYENERISIKKQLTLLKMCVTSLLCGPRAELWPFYGFLCKRFSLYIKVYQGMGTPAKRLD